MESVSMRCCSGNRSDQIVRVSIVGREVEEEEASLDCSLHLAVEGELVVALAFTGARVRRFCSPASSS